MRPSEVNIIYYDQFTTEVNVMEVVRRYIVKHVDGYPVNIRYEPVKSIHHALKLTPEEFERLMTSYHKPEDRSKYYLQPIETIHREVNEDEREPESLRASTSGTERGA